MDISMCLGLKGHGKQALLCPLRHTCVRHNAKPDTYQSYFMQAPFKDRECEYYIPDKAVLKKKVVKKYVGTKFAKRRAARGSSKD